MRVFHTLVLNSFLLGLIIIQPFSHGVAAPKNITADDLPAYSHETAIRTNPELVYKWFSENPKKMKEIAYDLTNVPILVNTVDENWLLRKIYNSTTEGGVGFSWLYGMKKNVDWEGTLNENPWMQSMVDSVLGDMDGNEKLVTKAVLVQEIILATYFTTDPLTPPSTVHQASPRLQIKRIPLKYKTEIENENWFELGMRFLRDQHVGKFDQISPDKKGEPSAESNLKMKTTSLEGSKEEHPDDYILVKGNGKVRFLLSPEIAAREEKTLQTLPLTLETLDNTYIYRQILCYLSVCEKSRLSEVSRSLQYKVDGDYEENFINPLMKYVDTFTPPPFTEETESFLRQALHVKRRSGHMDQAYMNPMFSVALDTKMYKNRYIFFDQSLPLSEILSNVFDAGLDKDSNVEAIKVYKRIYPNVDAIKKNSFLSQMLFGRDLPGDEKEQRVALEHIRAAVPFAFYVKREKGMSSDDWNQFFVNHKSELTTVLSKKRKAYSFQNYVSQGDLQRLSEEAHDIYVSQWQLKDEDDNVLRDIKDILGGNGNRVSKTEEKGENTYSIWQVLRSNPDHVLCLILEPDQDGVLSLSTHELPFDSLKKVELIDVTGRGTIISSGFLKDSFSNVIISTKGLAAVKEVSGSYGGIASLFRLPL